MAGEPTAKFVVFTGKNAPFAEPAQSLQTVQLDVVGIPPSGGIAALPMLRRHLTGRARLLPSRWRVSARQEPRPPKPPKGGTPTAVASRAQFGKLLGFPNCEASLPVNGLTTRF